MLVVPVGDAEVAIDLWDDAIGAGRKFPGGNRIGVTALVEEAVAQAVGGDRIWSGLAESPLQDGHFLKARGKEMIGGLRAGGGECLAGVGRLGFSLEPSQGCNESSPCAREDWARRPE